jgi:hypothetical protein
MTNATLDDRLIDVQQQMVREFSAVLPAETILQVTRESLENYRDARVSDFVPLFVSLEVRRRLFDMAQPAAS